MDLIYILILCFKYLPTYVLSRFFQIIPVYYLVIFYNIFSYYGQALDKKYKPNNRINQLTEQETVDPYTAQMLVYRAEMYIFNKYPYLIDMNEK